MRTNRPRRQSTGHDAAIAIGHRLRDLRKRRGFTQAELGQQVSLTQTLVSDYEIGRLRLNAELIIRFAEALRVTSDALLGLKAADTSPQPDRRLLRRLEMIEKLPKRDRQALLRNIDNVLKGAGVND